MENFDIYVRITEYLIYENDIHWYPKLRQNSMLDIPIFYKISIYT